MKSGQCDEAVAGAAVVQDHQRKLDVIPAKAGISVLAASTANGGSRFRGNDPVLEALYQLDGCAYLTALTIFSSWPWMFSLPEMTWPFHTEPVVPA